jgi:predicted transposase YdaD
MAMEYKNGFEEGKEIKLREIAEKLLADGYSVEKVVQYTELSREDVEKINIEKTPQT